MTWDDFNQQDLERDEKIPAADIDAASETAQNVAASQITPSNIWSRIMEKGRQIRDAYMSKKERKRELTVVASRVAPVATSDATTVAPYSPTNVRRLDNRNIVDATYRDVPQTQSLPLPESKRRPWLLGLSTIAIALGLAAVGLVNNYHFNAAFGHSSFESQQLGAIGFLIDAAAITLLPVSTILWRDRHRLYSLVAFSLWLAACVWSMNTTASFTAQLTGDQAAKRSSEITASLDTRDQRSAAIAIAADAVKLARTRADKLKATADLARANSAPIISTPLIATAEPEHMFATAAQNRFIRITGATIFPSLAGLFLTFGMLLLRRR